MWMSDKPLVQEKLAEDLANLVHCFPDTAVAVQFFGCFMKSMGREWFGIDQWRMDKFMMLVRRMVRQVLFKLAANQWTDVVLFGEWLARSVYDDAAPVGLVMHFNDLYLEEISKVGEGEIEPDTVHALIEPCVVFFAKSKDVRVIKHTKRNVFYKLMMQSERGQEYQEKYDIWKKVSVGHPVGTNVQNAKPPFRFTDEWNQIFCKINNFCDDLSDSRSVCIKGSQSVINILLNTVDHATNLP